MASTAHKSLKRLKKKAQPPKKKFKKLRAKPQFRCNYCKKNLYTPLDLKVHKDTEHYLPPPTNFDCVICVAPCSNLAELGVHMKTHPFECNHCSYKTFSKHLLQNHLIVNHFRGIMEYELCKVCGKLLTKKQLRQHQRRHEDERNPLDCPECGSVHYTIRTMYRHLKNAHSMKIILEDTYELVGLPRPDFSCPICKDDSMRNMHQLKIHMNKHPYECAICGFTSQRIQHLHRHLIGNHFQRLRPRAQCEVCKKFLAPTTLQKHMLIHATLDHFKCPLCPSGFKTKINASGHFKKYHPGAKNPFVTKTLNKA